MSSSYSIEAGFENIDPSEIIASSLSILQRDGWNILDYNDSSLKVEKATVGKHKATLTLSVSQDEVRISCHSELAGEAGQFIVDSFAGILHKFVSSPAFDQKVIELKHHYFMNNPLKKDEDENNDQAPSHLSTLFSFRKSFRVTPALVIINVIVFILMAISGVSIMNPQTIDVLNWGGNFRSYVLEGEWWRLITCCFIHIGVFHILLNMWALYDIGSFLERLIGSWRFLFAYIISGLAGSLNSIVWHFATPSAGASGAIFGMFGLFLALLTTNILEKGFRNAMLKSVLPMILFNLLIGTSAQIDNAGHIGGLLAGLVCGYLYAWHYKNPRSQLINLFSILIPIGLITFASVFIALKLPDPYSDYNKIMKEVSGMEKKALQIQSNNTLTMDSLAMSAVIWENALNEMKKAGALDLNKSITYQNENMIFYLKKRKQESMLLMNASENKELLKQNAKSIDSILTILNEKGQ